MKDNNFFKRMGKSTDSEKTTDSSNLEFCFKKLGFSLFREKD